MLDRIKPWVKKTRVRVRRILDRIQGKRWYVEVRITTAGGYRWEPFPELAERYASQVDLRKDAYVWLHPKNEGITWRIRDVL